MKASLSSCTSRCQCSQYSHKKANDTIESLPLSRHKEVTICFGCWSCFVRFYSFCSSPSCAFKFCPFFSSSLPHGAKLQLYSAFYSTMGWCWVPNLRVLVPTAWRLEYLESWHAEGTKITKASSHTQHSQLHRCRGTTAWHDYVTIKIDVIQNQTNTGFLHNASVNRRPPVSNYESQRAPVAKMQVSQVANSESTRESPETFPKNAQEILNVFLFGNVMTYGFLWRLVMFYPNVSLAYSSIELPCSQRCAGKAQASNSQKYAELHHLPGQKWLFEWQELKYKNNGPKQKCWNFVPR